MLLVQVTLELAFCQAVIEGSQTPQLFLQVNLICGISVNQSRQNTRQT